MILAYYFASGKDKDKNTLYTFETRRQGGNVQRSKEGLYKDDAERFCAAVKANPNNFGF